LGLTRNRFPGGRHRKEERTRKQLYARLLAEQKLAECAPSLLSLWQSEIELEADRQKIHSLFRESWMRSKLLVRVAREFGIDGL
jgi:hypothetical protein